MCGAGGSLWDMRRGCCCSLRTCLIIWLTLTASLSFFEIILGMTFGGFVTSFTDFVGYLARGSARHGAFRASRGLYTLAAHAETFSATFALLTSVRGCVDLVAVLVGTWGVAWKSTRALTVFIAITVLNVAVDAGFVVGGLWMLIELELFFQSPQLVIFVIFVGWRLFLGPYVVLIIANVLWIIRIGGTGGEGMSYREILQAQEATKEAKDTDAADDRTEGTTELRPEEEAPQGGGEQGEEGAEGEGEGEEQGGVGGGDEGWAEGEDPVEEPLLRTAGDPNLL